MRLRGEITIMKTYEITNHAVDNIIKLSKEDMLKQLSAFIGYFEIGRIKILSNYISATKATEKNEQFFMSVENIDDEMVKALIKRAARLLADSSYISIMHAKNSLNCALALISNSKFNKVKD